ncbi:MAG: AraC family transcriptional regulator, partial [Clostridia bacterium]
YHPYYELLLLIEGDVVCTIENKSYELKPYDLIFARPNEYHYLTLKSDKRYERYVIQFNANTLVPNVLTLIKDLDYFYSLNRTPLVSLYNKFDLYRQYIEHDSLQVLYSINISEILILLASYFKSFSKEPTIINVELEKIITYINSNLSSNLSAKTLCEKFYVSKAWLFDIFKKHLKTTPNEYITTKRIAKAQELLSFNAKPSQIYEQCGYKDYSTFYRAYVKHVGHSPAK